MVGNMVGNVGNIVSNIWNNMGMGMDMGMVEHILVVEHMLMEHKEGVLELEQEVSRTRQTLWM